MKKLVYILLMALCSPLVFSCIDALEEKVFSQITPDNLTTEDGIVALLGSSYGFTQNADRQRINMGEYPTDIAYQTGGFENGIAINFLTFSWDPSVSLFNMYYNIPYQAIRDANVLLENIDNATISQERIDLFKSEARFLRAFNYYRLYNWFGPTPLRLSSSDELVLPRATEEEFLTFIEQELLETIPILPDPGSEEAYGRATNGMALGTLTKFYLNTKQWQKCADTALELMNLNYYELFPVFEDMLKVENDGNREMIMVNAAIPQMFANNYMPAAFPIGFRSWPEKGLEMQSNWNNPQTQYRLRDSFYDSFEELDLRKEPILTAYLNNAGNSINLRDQPDNTRSFRYWPDPNAQGENHGNDVPEIRLADIILSRAEALNEVNGVNQISLDLINQVRTRAGLEDLQLSDFAGQDELRAHILKERAWEFYSEGLRREDLIRHEKFIDLAISRGVANARPFHNRYPIPLGAIDSNPALVQNDGY
ncbi:RagB/SusD family nutrient uptake outer membrane protein [Algoriphagus sp. AGSA1]|uniref:RagB/SusD family nutrient uptake outer membrane protein n=1 Tax=Algoriphagus sp. AGSA1 TaxID=2907213 RepID=UPI001F33811F|nr:RagB/SusD family nutrient uptake outer membrane protein [Algoriphagus sp. AGSA1]MCE7054246.1 RagB/SusD family nutrient uptake outer membrane protein [Algoriphagus sp. AGSA1]